MVSARKRHNSYCAFCRSPRRVPQRRGVGMVNVMGAMFVAGLLMWVMWQGFDPRVAVLFVMALAGAEIFLRFRWRLAIVCAQCGFDPAMYMKNPTLAAAKVKAQLEVRKQSPRALMAKPLEIPSVTPERAQEIAEIESLKASRPALLSKTI